MEVERPSHTCLVVPDLATEARRLQPVFGPFVRLGPAPGGDDFAIHGERHRLKLNVAWSNAGPVHLELIEGIPGSLWPPEQAAYLHHQGYWVNDLESESKRLAGLGWALEATQWSADLKPTRFAYHVNGSGMRIEIRIAGGPSLDGPVI